MKTVLSYKMKNDTFIVYKNETIYVERDGVSKTYQNIKEYEDEMGYILEDLFPSSLVLLAKSNLKWELYRLGNKFYEVLPSNKTVYLLEKDKRQKTTLPKGAVKVSWSKHPYKVLL